jgi:hypothetical protein
VGESEYTTVCSSGRQENRSHAKLDMKGVSRREEITREFSSTIFASHSPYLRYGALSIVFVLLLVLLLVQASHQGF